MALVELLSDYENICERYLLGELTESECQQMEEAYFADDSLFERFIAVKDDLLDAYSRGDLTSYRLERFERYFLTSAVRRQRVEEARALIRVATTASMNSNAGNSPAVISSEKRDSSWQWFPRNLSLQSSVFRLGSVAALLLIIVVGWILVRQFHDRSARPTAEEHARNVTKPEGDGVSGTRSIGQAPTSGLETGAQIASLTLLPFNSRDTGGAEPLTLSPEKGIVRLTLVFPGGPYDSFEASVRTVDGQHVVRHSGLKAGSSDTGKTVTLTFDSSLLTRQDYIASLRGRRTNGSTETIADYYFRVQHTNTSAPPK